MNDLDWLHWSLGRIGDAGIDLTPDVYRRFFERHPGTRTWFRDGSVQTQGRMLVEVIMMLTDQAAGHGYVEGSVATVVCDHGNYGPIGAADYSGFFTAVVASVCSALEDTGATADEVRCCRQVWQSQTAALLELTQVQLEAALALRTALE